MQAREKPMITRRDVFVAVLTMCMTAAAVAWAQSSAKSILHSSAFDFRRLDAQTTKVGERRAVFDAPTVTLDRLECHITTVNPGEEPHAPHQHPEEELMLIKEGTLEAMQNGQKVKVGPGSVLFQASNEFHGVKNVGDTPATYFVVKWWSANTPKSN
jgi:mannose-6-phosphate isomerase-like protein (cupin superfamily)